MPALLLYEMAVTEALSRLYYGRQYFEPHTYVNVQSWMAFVQGIYKASKSLTAMRVMINIANGEIGYLQRMRAKVLPAYEQQMKGWDETFAKARQEFSAYIPWLEADPTPVATAAMSAAIVYGLNGRPPIMKTLVELYNQITGVVDLGEEYSGAGGFVVNAYRSVDTQLSNSAPGEDKTLRDYFDSGMQGLMRFFQNIPRAAGNIAKLVAIGFGAIAAIYLLKK